MREEGGISVNAKAKLGLAHGKTLFIQKGCLLGGSYKRN